VIPDEDDLLVFGLGQLGGRGAAWTARRLRKDAYELNKTLSAPLDEVFASVASLLESIGTVAARTGPGDGEALVRGVVGSGAMNLNPAVITVSMTPVAQWAAARAGPPCADGTKLYDTKSCNPKSHHPHGRPCWRCSGPPTPACTRSPGGSPA